TVIRQLRDDTGNTAYKIRLTKEENGIRVSGLEKGCHLRVFTSNGVILYSVKVGSKTAFVPLNPHDTYLVSTGKEVVKYAF
ncbi:MAG: hypothetical protein J6Z18_03825, partial [Prevotella sp.]|nr:hypothetical protein [Prevotella sp.]